MSIRFAAPAALPVLLTACALLVASCGEPPKRATLERAQRLLAEAESLQAERYAPEELSKAREALEAAEAEYASQERGFALRRSPEPGNELAERAAGLAEAAAKRARGEKRAAARDARDAITRAETAMVGAEAAIAKLARCHRNEPIPDLRAYAERLESLQGDMATATAHFDEGEYYEVGPASAALIKVGERLVTDAGHAVWDAGCR